jgi:hypothetical protein
MSSFLYQLKLALTSPTGCGRSVGIVRLRTKTTEFSLVFSCSAICLQRPLFCEDHVGKLCSQKTVAFSLANVCFDILNRFLVATWTVHMNILSFYILPHMEFVPHTVNKT